MELVIINLWTKKETSLALKPGLCPLVLNKKIGKALQNLPKGSTSTKSNRKNSYAIDRKIQSLLKLDKFYLSMYNFKFYKVVVK